VARLCMGLIAGFMGAVLGFAIDRLGGEREEALKNATGLALVGLGMGAFYFLPLAEEARDEIGLLMALGLGILPLPIAGIVGQLALYYLRREAMDKAPRFGWIFWAPVLSLLLGSLGSLQLSTAGYGGVNAIPSDPTVVIVSIDTLRRDHLSIYGESPTQTPNFDALAERGLLFTDAITPMPETAPAHAAMMTGLHPQDSGVTSNGHVLAGGFTTLAERLELEGYATGAFLSSIAVASRTGLDQGFQVYDEDFFPWVPGFSSLTLARVLSRLAMILGDPTDYPYLLERPAPVTFDRALDWLGQNADRPSFAWVHLFDPHSPYEPHGLEGFETNGSPTAPALDHRSILTQEPGYDYTEAEREGLRSLYAEEVAWTDQQLGEFVSALEEQLAGRDWILVVTADHGEMLGEHGLDFNHHGIFEDAIRVPLVLVSSGVELENGRVDGQVRLMDLPTTVLSMLEIENPKMGEGIDLRSMSRGSQTEGVTSLLMGRKTAALSMGTLYGARSPEDGGDRRFKYISDPDDGELLFEVRGDPGEEHDLAEDQPTQLRSLQALVRARRGAGTQQSEVDEDVQRQLEALGYQE
jgi:choline-sulfatase